MAGYVELFVDQGATFNSVINLADDTTNANINIYGYTVTSQLRRSYYSANASANVTCLITDPDNGEITLSLTAGETANLKAGRYLFDVMLESDIGTMQRALEGIINIYPGVTR
jgi:hypothetical protein